MDRYIVAGGGIAGLTAANALADAGCRVTLFEQSERLGGRAITTEQRGFRINLGPHALYAKSHASRALREWKIPFTGARPDLRGDGAYLIDGGAKYPFFVTAGGLLRHPWFSWREKIEVMRALRLFTTVQQPRERSMAEWLANHAHSTRGMAYLRAMVRVATYATDLENLSAARALEQIRLAFAGGVLYLDGGWQTLVDGLAERARAKGVEIVTGRVDGCESPAILALPPAEIERVTGKKIAGLRPSRMACLTLGLRRLPAGAARFALGVDQPLYVSVHSQWAKLAPGEGALVHAGKYLTGAGDDASDRAELEAFVDVAMPGWRKEAEVIQFLPNMTVTHGYAACEGRPDIDALGMAGVAIAGDWVGAEGMLVDAAVSSALRAARSLQAKRAHAA